VNEDGLDKIT